MSVTFKRRAQVRTRSGCLMGRVRRGEGAYIRDRVFLLSLFYIHLIASWAGLIYVKIIGPLLLLFCYFTSSVLFFIFTGQYY